MTLRLAMGLPSIFRREIREATNRPESPKRQQHHPQGLVPGDSASPPSLQETLRPATTPACSQAGSIAPGQHQELAHEVRANASSTASRAKKSWAIGARTHFRRGHAGFASGSGRSTSRCSVARPTSSASSRNGSHCPEPEFPQWDLADGALVRIPPIRVCATPT